MAELEQADRHRGPHDGQCHRRVALSAGSAGQEAIAKRRIGLGVTGLADALIFCKTRYGSPESLALIQALAGRDQPRRLSRLSVELAQGKRRFSAVRHDAYLARPAYPGAAGGYLRRHCRAWHPQCAADLHRAHRHHFAVGRQCLQRHRAGLRLQLYPQGAAAGRQQNRREGRGLCRARIPRPFRRGCARCRIISSTPRPWRPPIIWRCRPRPALYRQRHFQDHQCAARRFPSTTSRMFTCRPMTAGCKGCTTYRPNDVTGSVLSVEEPQGAIPAEAVIAASDEPELPLPLPRARERGGVVYMTRPLDRPEGCWAAPTRSNGWKATMPSTSPSTISRRTGGGGRSRSSSIPRIWKPMPGRWR